jgi:menaquinone-dependent protoporphyrinogen oxidase
MNPRVLVAYATKYGATAGIAEKIGTVLREAGLAVDVLPAERVGDLGPYRAVVLGSAVYIGQWRKEAAAFLKTNEKALAERPVWLFSSGPTGREPMEKALQGWRFPEGLQPFADRIKPRDITNFRGAADPKRLSFAEKLVLKGVKAPVGDFRDWEAISAWAQSIAAALK